MNTISMISTVLILLGALTTAARSHTSGRRPATGDHSPTPLTLPAAVGEKEQKESPIACAPNALTPAERKRHFDELSPLLRKIKTGIRELKDGYEFQFPSDRKSFDLVAEWAIQEQLCCPFFEISVRLAREGGPLSLRLTGRKGVKEFIRDDFAPWFKA